MRWQFERMTNPGAQDMDGDTDAESILTRMRERISRVTGREFGVASFDAFPPVWEHAYWRAVMTVYPGVTESPRALFEAGGFPLPSPGDLDDDQLTVRLWQLIRRMERVGIYLTSTDHLDDRALYSWLRSVGLDTFVITAPGSTSSYTMLDIIGSGSDEDFETWARYYMDAAEREHWAEEHPDEPLPETKPRPFNRDRFLPRFTPYFANGDELGDMSWLDDADDDSDAGEGPDEGDEWKR